MVETGIDGLGNNTSPPVALATDPPAVWYQKEVALHLQCSFSCCLISRSWMKDKKNTPQNHPPPPHTRPSSQGPWFSVVVGTEAGGTRPVERRRGKKEVKSNYVYVSHAVMENGGM